MSPLLLIYLLVCFAVAWIGRDRVLGLWGNFILAFFLSPILLAVILLIGMPRKVT